MTMKNQSIVLIGRELHRILKPILAVGIAIGGGLIPFLGYTFGWVTSLQIATIVILAFLILLETLLIWRLAKVASS